MERKETIKRVTENKKAGPCTEPAENLLLLYVTFFERIIVKLLLTKLFPTN